VRLGAGVILHSHVAVEGRTTVGARTQIFPFASIGHTPQDLKFGGEESELISGEEDMIREHVTMNPGTRGGGMVTRVGKGCLFMMGSHVAHDCIIGDGVIMANNATLAGHVAVGDYAIIGGLSAIQQFARIGHNAMIGGMSGIEQDVLPYGLAMGERASLNGLNIIGLKRSGTERGQIRTLQAAYDTLFDDSGTFGERVIKVADLYAGHGVVDQVLEFVRAESSRGLLQPKKK
jgi:UDP-N-acetylglucosamine acyltransferase